jgi:DNA-directed RNA polymerase subunit M/transcription elongation factor TFIIS
MICDRCHAGQMLFYERKVGSDGKATIRGTRCSVCGYVALDSDDDIWSAVGL